MFKAVPRVLEIVCSNGCVRRLELQVHKFGEPDARAASKAICNP